ncbi:Protein gir2 [Emydomyces testavorans]|uniref:Protein gir2 n=1 Tax=Emydomyces testavorans TaxID=2070801 RepID=A0AAF0DM21_9EURO|nr:Protein gir2 [Emydomyces testavorans]
MGRADQEEERETLKAIFPDEITDVSEDTYRISITLDVSHHGKDYFNPPILILQVSYPEDYPDVAPRLEISAPPNAPKYPHLDVQEDRDRLLESLQTTVEENMGMAMVFTLVDTLKEGAELLISERQAAVQAMKEFEAAKAEEEENRKFHGEAVTRESFLAWREKFRQEMEEEEKRRQEEREAEEKKKKGAAKEPKKLTGKQLWERGLAGKADYDEDDLLPTKLASIDVNG